MSDEPKKFVMEGELRDGDNYLWRTENDKNGDPARVGLSFSFADMQRRGFKRIRLTVEEVTPPPTSNEIAKALMLLTTVGPDGRGGLYGRATSPIDWENAKKAGQNPVLIRGGTHVVDGGDIQCIQTPFFVELTDDGFQVSYFRGQRVEQQPFKTLPEAIEFILDGWRPPTIQAPRD